MADSSSLSIRIGNVDELENLMALVPELDPLRDRARVAEAERQDGLLLIAEVAGEPAGFKFGYARYDDGSYYSWLGGVTPEYRGERVAQALLEAQEAWVAERGYTGIYVKTLNKFVGMRVLLAKNRYDLVSLESAENEPGAETQLVHFKSVERMSL